MYKKHVIETSLIMLFVLLSSITIFMYYIGLYSPTISTTVVILLVAGLATGILIPNILLTWAVIVLTTIGSAILLLGNVAMPLHLKISLLAVFPVGSSVMVICRYILGGLGWVDSNRRDIEKYSEHYDQVTKLQTTHNAQKIYQKALRFIQNDQKGAFSVHITAVHWAHSGQFRQFHDADYDQVLQKIAKVLKNDRLPSEFLYYLDNATFLIISYDLTSEYYQILNERTRKHLSQIDLVQTTPQFKWGDIEVNNFNVNSFLTLEDAIRSINRKMETDIVTEYLKGD